MRATSTSLIAVCLTLGMLLPACGPEPAPNPKSPAERGECSLSLARSHLQRITMNSDDAAACKVRCAAGSQEACVSLGVLAMEGSLFKRSASEAMSRFEAGCTAGYTPGCAHLGHLLELLSKDSPASPDHERAKELLSIACDAGDAWACLQLGVLLDKGDAVSPVEVRARAAGLFMKACEGGEDQGCFALSLSLEQGVAEGLDQPKVVAALTKACKADRKLGCSGLTYLQRRDRCDSGAGEDCLLLAAQAARHNDARRLALTVKACDAGSATGCFQAAHLFESTDDARATELYGRCCGLQQMRGCSAFASRIALGKGGGVDESSALAALTKACDAENQEACRDLALILRTHTSIPADQGRAIQILTKSCDAGDGASCHALALQQAEGVGTKTNEPRALALLGKACDLGHGPGCYDLGVRLFHGVGAKKDRVKATTLFTRGCKLGNEDCCATEYKEPPAPKTSPATQAHPNGTAR